MIKKFKIFILLILLINIFTIPAFSKIGIIGALEEEIVLIKNEMKIKAQKNYAGRIFYIGKIHQCDVVLSRSGIGKINSAVITQIMITVFNVDKIIFTGIAGGVNPELGIGDIVISNKLYQHDFGIWEKDGFVKWEEIKSEDGTIEKPAYYEADRELLSLAIEVSKELMFDEVPEILRGKKIKPRVVEGVVVTGDQFIAREEKRIWLFENFDADAVEMEGAAVAQVCFMNKIPFIIIRSLSDLANENAKIDIDIFKNYAAKNSARIVKAILKKIKKKR